MASETFNYVISLLPTGTNGTLTYFDVESGIGANGLVTDTSDHDGDNLSQLGDIGSDIFTATGVAYSSTPLHYVGATPHGFVGSLHYVAPDNSFSGTYYYLFTSDSAYGSMPPTAITTDSNTHYALCFASGTAIRTARGEVAVEDLREGEDVITASGAARAIQWIGHRRTDCARHPRPKDVWPVLVEAGALGNATPSRDLYLTPYHAVALTCGSEVLVPIHCLINGSTIRQVPVDEITYWHVELQTHDILVANGAAAESYLDTGNRAGFANAGGPSALHPDFKPAADAEFCRPLVTSGPILSAIRANLPCRAGDLAA